MPTCVAINLCAESAGCSLGKAWVLGQGESLAAHPMGRSPVRLVGISPVMICSRSGKLPDASTGGQDSTEQKPQYG